MSAGVRVVALSGGIGGAKLALGLYRLLPPDCLMVVCNTGDDFEHLGLHLAGSGYRHVHARGHRQSGDRLGTRGETWTFMAALAQLGGETWFRLGDADLATHVERTRRLAAGESLSSDHRRLLPAPGRARPGHPHVRRAGAHHGPHRGRRLAPSNAISWNGAASRK